NFSVGRDENIIHALLDAISEADAVRILDYSSDRDHNRTVITFTGTARAIEDAAFRAIKTAAELIDMREHVGVHPRLGATDVVPFVPLRGTDMQTCVEIAKRLGQRVGDSLELPVYLYEAAATAPHRRNLADVRRGQYEGLAKKMSNPVWQPDYGSTDIGTAGAVVIGARKPLIAFNVYLVSDDVRIAKRIARAIRESNGGLVSVKALGLLVKGQAQVSMNLVDYKRSPIYRVMEMIRREAQRYGVQVAGSELIGLIPQDALLDTAAWYLQLNDFTAKRVLDNHLPYDGNEKPDIV
ncbi:MAG: glutamate formimidoyltransferase, partial [Aggregatilineales bacterium]